MSDVPDTGTEAMRNRSRHRGHWQSNGIDMTLGMATHGGYGLHHIQQNAVSHY